MKIAVMTLSEQGVRLAKFLAQSLAEVAVYVHESVAAPQEATLFSSIGDLTAQVLRIPGTSVDQSQAMQSRIEREIARLPEVRFVFSKTGTAELAFGTVFGDFLEGTPREAIWVVWRFLTYYFYLIPGGLAFATVFWPQHALRRWLASRFRRLWGHNTD